MDIQGNDGRQNNAVAWNIVGIQNIDDKQDSRIGCGFNKGPLYGQRIDKPHCTPFVRTTQAKATKARALWGINQSRERERERAHRIE